jgi:hypothetical protein
VLGFVVAVRGRTGQLTLQVTTTVPVLLGIGLLTAGWTLIRTPRRVGVGPDGLSIESKQGFRHVRWDEVGCATTGTGPMSHRRLLNVTDLNGKSIVKLDESFDRFDEMVAMIAGRVEAKGDDTAACILRKKGHRNAILTGLIGLLLLGAAVGVAWMTHQDLRAARLLAEKGEPGEAQIVRRFVAPNGVTKRVEYRVVGPSGTSGTRNTEVTPQYWDRLEGVRSIPVIYVRQEPDISRLAQGEVRDQDFTKTPTGGYGLAALGGLLALFLIGASPFAWLGWDLGHDSKTNRWSVKRYGKVVWSSRG